MNEVQRYFSLNPKMMRIDIFGEENHYSNATYRSRGSISSTLVEYTSDVALTGYPTTPTLSFFLRYTRSPYPRPSAPLSRGNPLPPRSAISRDLPLVFPRATHSFPPHSAASNSLALAHMFAFSPLPSREKFFPSVSLFSSPTAFHPHTTSRRWLDSLGRLASQPASQPTSQSTVEIS